VFFLLRDLRFVNAFFDDVGKGLSGIARAIPGARSRDAEREQANQDDQIGPSRAALI
jgi:hypothetical protein